MKKIEIMNRAKFVKQGVEMVFVCDLSGLELEDSCKVVSRTEDIISRMPMNSVRALMNVSEERGAETSKEHTRKLLNRIRPHVQKVAVSGVSNGRSKRNWEEIASSLESNVECFECYDDAFSWLVDSKACTEMVIT